MSEGKQPKFGFVVLGICVDVCLTIGTDQGITKDNEDLKRHTFWIDDLGKSHGSCSRYWSMRIAKISFGLELSVCKMTSSVTG